MYEYSVLRTMEPLGWTSWQTLPSLPALGRSGDVLDTSCTEDGGNLRGRSDFFSGLARARGRDSKEATMDTSSMCIYVQCSSRGVNTSKFFHLGKIDLTY